MHQGKNVFLLQEPIIVFDFRKSPYKLQMEAFGRRLWSQIGTYA